MNREIEFVKKDPKELKNYIYGNDCIALLTRFFVDCLIVYAKNKKITLFVLNRRFGIALRNHLNYDSRKEILEDTLEDAKNPRIKKEDMEEYRSILEKYEKYLEEILDKVSNNKNERAYFTFICYCSLSIFKKLSFIEDDVINISRHLSMLNHVTEKEISDEKCEEIIRKIKEIKIDIFSNYDSDSFLYYLSQYFEKLNFVRDTFISTNFVVKPALVVRYVKKLSEMNSAILDITPEVDKNKVKKLEEELKNLKPLKFKRIVYEVPILIEI